MALKSKTPTADHFDRMRGRMCGLVESWGLDERRERGMISMIKSLSYDAEAAIEKVIEDNKASASPRVTTDDA